MVIGERFAWGHLQKTAGDATLGLFGLFPDLVVFADPRNTEAKHASFGDRKDQIEGKLLVANIRRLPAWTVSWAQHRARLALRPDGSPVPMNSPEQMVRVPRADRCLGALTAQGRFRVDRWLRMEHLADDFADARHQHVHGCHRFAVVIEPHVEGFDFAGVIEHRHG